MSGDKTEKPTAKRRKKAADQGDRLISREATAAAAMLFGIIAAGSISKEWAAAWRRCYHDSLALSYRGINLEPTELARAARSICVTALLPTLAISCAAVGAAVSVGLLQGGGQIKLMAIAPKWSKVNPLNNAKRLFGQEAAVRTFRSLLPGLGIAWLFYRQWVFLQSMPALSVAVVPTIPKAVYDLLLGSSIVMLAWSAADLLSTWRTREQRLKMSKQDIRDESKEAEGSPQIKGRIRSIRSQLRSRRMRQDVGKATVVITNPTHYAVALGFDFDLMTAPKVLVKGRDILAAKIRKEASWAGVPIVENPLLARSLYRTVEPGQCIPFELYAAVAGILAHLYRSAVEAHLPPTLSLNEVV